MEAVQYKPKHAVHTCPECKHTWYEGIPMAMNCTKCNHTWSPRVANPVKCARCGAKSEFLEEITA